MYIWKKNELKICGFKLKEKLKKSQLTQLKKVKIFCKFL